MRSIRDAESEIKKTISDATEDRKASYGISDPVIQTDLTDNPIQNAMIVASKLSEKGYTVKIIAGYIDIPNVYDKYSTDRRADVHYWVRVNKPDGEHSVESFAERSDTTYTIDIDPPDTVDVEKEYFNTEDPKGYVQTDSITYNKSLSTSDIEKLSVPKAIDPKMDAQSVPR